jgi:hypothetical protein
VKVSMLAFWRYGLENDVILIKQEISATIRRLILIGLRCHR